MVVTYTSIFTHSAPQGFDRVDPNVAFEDQVGVMKELQQEGKIAHFGLSEVDVEQIDTARTIIDVAAVQNIYNVTTRKWDDVVAYCEKERIPLRRLVPGHAR